MLSLPSKLFLFLLEHHFILTWETCLVTVNIKNMYTFERVLFNLDISPHKGMVTSKS